MGSDFNNNPKYNMEKYISMKIELNKICYNPDEFIKGTIILSPKSEITQKKFSTFSNPSINFTITQIQLCNYNDDGNLSKSDVILFKEEYFKNYINSNLLTNLNIPFSIRLPEKTIPTCLNNPDYCKHFLTIYIPSIEAKKTVLIIVKNNPNFTIENKLLKSPTIFFKEINKKSFLFNKGRIACFLKLPKNSWDYNDQIPIEIILDCSELDLKVNGIYIAIIRNKKQYNRKHSEILSNNNITIFSKNYLLDKKQKRYKLKPIIQFPTSSDYISIFPPTVYKLIESNGQNDLFDKINQYVLYPMTKGGLISIEYYLNVKILFDSKLSFDEDFKIPLDFYSSFEIENENVIEYPNENEINRCTADGNDNNNSETDNFSAPPIMDSNDNITNSGDNLKPSNQTKDENDLKDKTDLAFEIIDQDDFYNILTNKNK